MESPHKNKTRTRWIYVIIGVIIVLGLAYVFFQEDIQERGEGLERMWEREENYKAENPNATDAEAKEAFDKGIDGIKKREQNYKAQNPDATDAEVGEAFDAIREK